MAYAGGINDEGTIFKIKSDGTAYSKLLDFEANITGNFPTGTFISDGTFLYAMVEVGGANGLGTIFKIKPDGTGFEKLLDFAGDENGSNPFGSLISDGTFLYACASPVKKIRISNPSEITTVSGASCTYDLTTDGTHLYVLEGPWGPVTKMSVNGGSKTTVYSGSFSDSNGVTTDGSFLYIFDGGHVKKINLSNNQFVSNLQHSGARGLRGTMVGETLYISGTNIRKISTSGSNFSTLISGVYSEGLGSDGTHIYYADGSTLKRYTIASGAISTVKSGLGGLRGIVTDGTHLYVTVTGGQVKKIRGQ